MSAIDFAARGLALRATALTPLTFAELPQAPLPDTVTRIASSGHSEPGHGAAVYISDSLADAALQAAYPAAVFQARGGRRFRLACEEQGFVSPEQFGWAEGNTDTGALISDGFAYQRAVAIEQGRLPSGVVELTQGTTYELANIGARTFPGSGYQHSIGRMYCPPGCTIRGNGATLKANSAGGWALIKQNAEFESSHVVTGPMAAGAKVFQLATVAEAAQFAVGDKVLWRLGDVSYDTLETYNWDWAIVTAVNAGTGQITLDHGISEAWDGAVSVGRPEVWPYTQHNARLYRARPVSGLVVDNVRMEPADGATLVYGIHAYGGWSASWRQLRCKGGGIPVIQYHKDFHFDYVESGQNGHPNAIGMSIAESRGRIDHLAVSDCRKFGAYVEYACDISIGFLHDVVVNDSNVANERHRGIYANGRSRVHVENALFEGGAYYLCGEAANESWISWGRVRVVAYAPPATLPVPGYNCDRLELRIAGTDELYIGTRARWVEQTIFLTDGMTLANGVFDFASGAVIACNIVFGGGAVAADFSNFYVGRQTWAVDLKNNLVPTAATTQEISFITAYTYGLYVPGAKPGFGGSSPEFAKRAEKARITIATPAGSSLVGSGKYVRVRMLIVPNELAASADTVSTAMIAREQADTVYEGQAATAALNASIAAGATVSQTVTVTGLAAGDLADASFSVALNPGLQKLVEAVTNGVKVSLTNPTGSAITGPNGTIHAQGRKRRLGA